MEEVAKPASDPSHAGRIHFPNLNGLRFFAALAVIVFHVEVTKEWFGLPRRFDPILAHKVGHLGVILFFVLSGFLITYLLLDEKSRGPIRIWPFYVRRILRIWPLYYVIVILGLYVFPQTTFFSWPGVPPEEVQSQIGMKTLLFVAFLPNLLAVLDFIPYAAQTWSIGVEEQFYLVWPHLMSRVRNKTALMLAIIFGQMALGAFLWTLNLGPLMTPLLRDLYRHANFDCLAIGGLMAVGLYESKRWIARLMTPLAFVAALAVSALLVATGPVFEYRTYAIPFAVIVLNFAANPSMSTWLESKPLRYLGEISYGLYMWHFVAIVLALQFLARVGYWADIVLFPVSIVFSIALAAASYRWLETPFLRMKRRFA